MPLEEMSLDGAGAMPAESSADIASRVSAARQRQAARAEDAGVRLNSELEDRALRRVASPDAAGQKLLVRSAERYRLSARGYHRILRVARTIADLADSEAVEEGHVAEALSYRRRVGTY